MTDSIPSNQRRNVTNERLRTLIAHVRDELNHDTHPLYSESYLNVEKDMVAAFEELLERRTAPETTAPPFAECWCHRTIPYCPLHNPGVRREFRS